ncbi:MAG TPA: hypothetical protein VI462_11990 [Acidimicrobiia bacterium]
MRSIQSTDEGPRRLALPPRRARRFLDGGRTDLVGVTGWDAIFERYEDGAGG